MQKTHSPFFKVMHWLFASVILGAIGIAFYMDDMPFSPQKMQLINYHKWLGVLALILAAPRIYAGLTGYAKRPLSTWEDTLAHICHKLMYVLMVIVPLAGMAMSQAKGYPVVLFGLVPMPTLPFVTKDMAEMLTVLHVTSANLLVATVVLHVVGAVKRQLSGDKVISRMK